MGERETRGERLERKGEGGGVRRRRKSEPEDPSHGREFGRIKNELRMIWNVYESKK